MTEGEWAAVFIDRKGQRQYLANTLIHPDRLFTTYRGSSARYTSREVALERGNRLKDARARQGWHLYPWIAEVIAERIK